MHESTDAAFSSLVSWGAGGYFSEKTRKTINAIALMMAVGIQ
ncbi:hypothetical protein O9992_07615 [Vibrio lentus]|nr:hypothetical protein [Vibrio lentus]